MKTTGIIAEYNPFHNGHLYQMEKARALSGADYIIAVMSPDFVQRGAPALLDKWTRARMALEAGADLVLELPIRSATGSAEFFAQGGVSLLSSLGVVDALSFGCETDNLAPLEEYAHFLCMEEPEEYRTLLQSALKEGTSFAKARCRAFMKFKESHLSVFKDLISSSFEDPHPADFEDTDITKLKDSLSSPNNILAIEYLKAIYKSGSRMRPVPVLRVGAGYHDRSLSCCASASGIRSALIAGKDVRSQMSSMAYELLQEELSSNRFLTSSDLDLPLHLKLTECRDSLSDYLDVSEDLANRIGNLLPQYTGFEQFTDLLKTKQIAHTRISRALLHILLGLKKRTDTIFPQYARVLGFRKSAQPLLSKIKEYSSIPLITKLPPDSQMSTALREDLNASELWELLVSHKTGAPVRRERQRQIVLLS